MKNLSGIFAAGLLLSSSSAFAIAFSKPVFECNSVAVDFETNVQIIENVHGLFPNPLTSYEAKVVRGVVTGPKATADLAVNRIQTPNAMEMFEGDNFNLDIPALQPGEKSVTGHLNMLLNGQQLTADLNCVSKDAAPAIPAPEYSTLSNIQADPQLRIQGRVDYGNVTMDLAKKSARLLLQGTFCPVGAKCLVVNPPPFTVTLPITKVQTDKCGSTIIVASEDKRPVDGALQTLTIVDNTGNICKTMVALPATSVAYDTDAISRNESSEIKTHTTAIGDALKTLD